MAARIAILVLEAPLSSDGQTNGGFETREQHQLKKLLQRSETCILCCRNKFRLVRSLVFLQLAMKAERKKEKKKLDYLQ